MDPLQFPFPLRLDADKRLADPDWEEHVDEMVRQVLLTSPGERVNRPDFGTGILAMVFTPAGPSLAALQVLIQTSLARWLGTLIEVNGVSVTSEDSTVQVSVAYTLRATRATRTVSVTA
jgi:uncharacterized protein